MTLNDPNLLFKVTPFFDTAYLTDGYRYGHSYYRMRLGNRNQAFDFRVAPISMTLSDFNVTLLFNVK